MERKDFLKNGITALGVAFIAPLAGSCKKDNTSTSSSSSSSSTSGSTSTSTSSTCVTTDSETAGPYPTKSPSSYVRSNIVNGQTGLALTIKIIINNSNNSCNPVSGALVDIWHCNALGYYSEYDVNPGDGLAIIDYTSSHFLRGRQTTDSNGLVTFTSIFPGWYTSRAPHIHVHVYNSSGTSLLVTQIAFPTDVCNTVYTTVSPYSEKGEQDTSNTSDSVFSDSLADELASVTGNTTDGYVLTMSINVAA